MSSLQFFLIDEAKSKGLKFGPPRDGDAGFDLPALESTVIAPGTFAAIRTGVHVAIPNGFVGIVRDRSSLGFRGALTGAGVIDSSYRGEIKILMHNFGTEPLVFEPGDRIAQLVVLSYLPGRQSAAAPSLEALGETERAAAGFGSTGR